MRKTAGLSGGNSSPGGRAPCTAHLAAEDRAGSSVIFSSAGPCWCSARGWIAQAALPGAARIPHGRIIRSCLTTPGPNGASAVGPARGAGIRDISAHQQDGPAPFGGEIFPPEASVGESVSGTPRHPRVGLGHGPGWWYTGRKAAGGFLLIVRGLPEGRVVSWGSWRPSHLPNVGKTSGKSVC